MFLENIMEALPGVLDKYNMKACTYPARYAYWRDNLFERIMRLFVWKTGTDLVIPKEIEQRLIIDGKCSIQHIKREKELTAVFCNFFGVTKYYDEFKKITYHTPIDAGERTIGKDCVIIENNALRNPVLPLIHSYAMMLAHAEVTFIDICVNARDHNGIPIASTEIGKQAVKSYQRSKFNGKYDVIADPSFIGVQFTPSGDLKSEVFKELWEVRNNILRDFYSDIGVKVAFEKNSNVINAEIEANDSMLLLNIKDMIEYRKRGAEAVNKLFGTEWSVEVAEEIRYEEKEEENDVQCKSDLDA